MLVGWIPSLIFFAMAEKATTDFDKECFFKALSGSPVRISKWTAASSALP